MNDKTTGAPQSDDDLLDAVARMWEKLDPPPADLADGVLARLAAQDLEYELLTLVESDEGEPAYARRRCSALPTRPAPGRWSTSARVSACSCASPGGVGRPGSTAGSRRRSR
jgi:hypothetical protein